MDSDRAVFIRYARNGERRRGSGLRVGGRFVLTADHCANGTDHEVIVGGEAYPATVHVRSETRDADLAVLVAPGLPRVEPLSCALVARNVTGYLNQCVALGYPVWKDKPGGGQRLEQARGDVPTATGIDPFAVAGAVTLMTFKITDPEARGRPTPAGDLDASTLWPGMSGAVVVTADDLIVGVIRSHNLAEGGRSLTMTPLDAIDTLPDVKAELAWASLSVIDPHSLSTLPLPPPSSHPNVGAVRRFVEDALSEADLDDMCLDHFLPVYRDFSATTGRRAKVRMLVEYADRQDRLAELVTLTRAANPGAYARNERDLRT